MKKTILGSAMLSALAVGAICMMVLMYSADVEKMNPEIQEAIRKWNPLADDDPGAGESGVLNIFIYPHSADPATTYGSNVTEGGAYAYGHLNSTLTGYVPYNTAFDIVVKYRFNDTVCQSTSNNTFMLSWVNSTIRCTDLSINANTTMSKANITTHPDYMWVNFYMNNGGAG